MNIEECLKNNKTYNIFNKGAIHKVQKLIENNEEILYALVSNVSIFENNSISFANQNKVFGGAMQVKNVLNGIVVITDKRIIFCNSTLGTTNEKQIMIKDIQSIDEHISGLTKTGELRIVGITETFVVKVLRKGLNEEIKKAIDKAKNFKSNSNNIGSIASNADEIRKYKQLYEDGIITQEEFERKKQELLK
nr:MAG TPA: Short C-terminal domain [Caudoviricetes sp.]